MNGRQASTGMPREVILKKLGDLVSREIPIVGAGAGTGISAKCAQAGGADLIVIYNSGRFRMAGHGSLSGLMPYGMPTGSSWKWRVRSCPWPGMSRFLPASAEPIRSA